MRRGRRNGEDAAVVTVVLWRKRRGGGGCNDGFMKFPVIFRILTNYLVTLTNESAVMDPGYPS